MDLSELKIKNAIYKYGLSEADIKALEEEQQKDFEEGNVYLFRKKGFVYGVDHDRSYTQSEKSIIRTRKKGIAKFPAFYINDVMISFTISKEEAEFISEAIDLFNIGLKAKVPSMKAFKEQCKDNMMNGKVEGRYGYRSRDKLKDLSEDELELIFKVFDQTMPKFTEKDYDVGYGIKKILKVFEHKNHRFSLVGSGSSEHSIRTFKHTAKEYNYIDEGRLFYYKMYILDIEKPDGDILSKCGNGDRHTFHVVRPEEYNKIKVKYNLQIEKEKKDRELREKVRTMARSKLEDCSTKPVKLNGITFKDGCISYQEQEISGTIGEWQTSDYGRDHSFQRFINHNVAHKDPEKLDFNEIYEDFCKSLAGYSFDGKLGSVPIVIKKETFWYINDFRINKDDVVEMISRAICFDNAEEYNKLLKRVSKCNLKIHDVLNNGLKIEYSDRDSPKNPNQFLRLKVRRDKNRNVLAVGDNEFRISQTQKLIHISTIGKRGYRSESIDFHKVCDTLKAVFPDFMDEQIIVIFEDGLQEYKRAEKESAKFLKEAIKVLKVKTGEKDGHSGYIIKGSSGKKYLLTDDLNIYDHKTMRYICVIDKDLGSSFNTDKLVNRMYALANDSFVAKEVFTLNEGDEE
ncbi:MAG: hypothetical protein GY861_17310 [bacterium]|nr:hypothetical protein [bacterium]